MEESMIHAWARLGDHGLEAAEALLAQSAWRSAISRGYYSSMATTHAILGRLGVTAPARGNWSNPELPAVLLAALKARAPGNGAWAAAAKIHRDELMRTWAYRLQADYRPRSGVAEAAAQDAIKCARRLRRRWEILG